MRTHCPKCGAFVSPAPEQPGLFERAGLPIPAPGDPFFDFHKESQQREAQALRRGQCRAVGAERQARRAFTMRALGATT